MIREGGDGRSSAIAHGLQCGRTEAVGEAGGGCRSGAAAFVVGGRSRRDEPQGRRRDWSQDRQTLRDWAHRFNAKGPEGLINGKAPGPVPKLSAEQKQELRRIVETGPDPARDGVVRWRCVDLRRVIKERFDVDLDEVSIGRTLKELGFAHVSPRPQHPKQDPQAIEAFKKTFPSGWRRRSPARG